MSRDREIEPTAIARFFSSMVVKEMARRGKSPTLARLIRESGALPDIDTVTVGDFLDSSFNRLRQRQHRHEYIYKAAITKKVLLGTHSLQTASMITEFRVGDCKADVVILNGTATVYEIKSERDSLSRLQRQIDSYRRVFATTNVIAGENHLDEVLALTPEDVGVLKLSSRYNITPIRKGECRADQTSPEAIFDAITLSEAAAVLAANGVETPDVPNTQRHGVLREAFIDLAPSDAHRGMVACLKRSRSLLSLQALLEDLPESLHAASLTTRLRIRDHERLVTAVSTPLRRALLWG